MAIVTVTGGHGQPNVKLSFDAGRTGAEARGLAYMISQQFSGTTAAYVDATHNPGGLIKQDPTAALGYAVVNKSGTDAQNGENFVMGYQAVTVEKAATVFGGASGGQTVISDANLFYSTTGSNGTVVLGGAATSNTVALHQGGNTVYGGDGSDTIDIQPEQGPFIGASVIYAGNGTTLVNVAANSGHAVVYGSQDSVSASLTVNNGDAASYVDGGFGTLIETGAAGTVVGGSAGNNTITGSLTAPVTINGGGANDLLQGYTAGTSITGAGDGTTINVFSGGETVNAGYGTTHINVGAASGTVSINGGDGASTISISADNQAQILFTAGLGDVTYLGSSMQGTTASPSVLVAGPGRDFISAGSGNTSLVASDTGYSALRVGAGPDTINGSATNNGVFDFSLITDPATQGTAAGQNYLINSFHVGDKLYVSDQSSINYLVNAQNITGGNDVVTFQNGAKLTLNGVTTALTNNDFIKDH